MQKPHFTIEKTSSFTLLTFKSIFQDFDFRAHDSAFKDRYMQLHNVRVRFIPTDKSDIHDLGPLEEVYE